ncbi:MAG: NAD(P)-dependent oxidoreductase [Bacteroidota bacterium]
MKILLTSTSFQDTPGKHQDVLKSTGFDVDYLRGPVKSDVLLPLIGQYDAIICGDDEYTREVLQKGKSGKLKVISKYGIGLDKIDLEAASDLGIKVVRCKGVNHITVSEHILALLFSFYKNIPEEIHYTRNGEWKRLIGHEIFRKRIGIIGLGRIGQELAKRCKALGMDVYGYDPYVKKQDIAIIDVTICPDIESLVSNSEIISLNVPLTKETSRLINKELIEKSINQGTVIVNTARGGLVDEDAIMNGVDDGTLAGYLTDVLDEEPMKTNHPFRNYSNIFITPHIGSRTYQSVERQGTMAVNNLIHEL